MSVDGSLHVELVLSETNGGCKSEGSPCREEVNMADSGRVTEANFITLAGAFRGGMFWGKTKKLYRSWLDTSVAKN